MSYPYAVTKINSCHWTVDGSSTVVIMVGLFKFIRWQNLLYVFSCFLKLLYCYLITYLQTVFRLYLNFSSFRGEEMLNWKINRVKPSEPRVCQSIYKQWSANCLLQTWVHTLLDRACSTGGQRAASESVISKICEHEYACHTIRSSTIA